MEFPTKLQTEIIDFLKSLPALYDSESQRAFIYQAGLDLSLQEQIPFGKPLGEFTSLFVSTLINYGSLEALESVLKIAHNYVGEEKKTYCNILIDKLHAISIKSSTPPQKQAMKLQKIACISDTGISSIFIAQQPNGNKVLLKQRKKDSIFNLDYSMIKLNSNRIAIPTKIWTTETFVYEIIPYRRGWPLSEIIKLNNGGIGGNLICSWTLELLELLQMLHTHNPPIIHRDIKPENILISEENLELILLDIASAVFFKKHTSYTSVGTDGYVPPEQIEGRPTPASDLYALAGTLVKMNSNMPPPNYFDRQRRNLKFKLFDVDTRVVFLFRFIAQIDLSARPKDGKEAMEMWNNFEPQTFGSCKTLKAIKLPNGNEIQQHLLCGGGATDVVV